VSFSLSELLRSHDSFVIAPAQGSRTQWDASTLTKSLWCYERLAGNTEVSTSTVEFGAIHPLSTLPISQQSILKEFHEPVWFAFTVDSVESEAKTYM
jgi:hypothetical protein